ncbi:MAG: S1/P1 nuclease [Rhodospirillaceae bacterium]
MSPVRCKALALALLVVGGAPALAWNADGHRVVCTIAWDETTDAARSNVNALLDISSREQFVDACQWLETQAGARSWHWNFVPRDEKGVDPARDCCMLREVERSLAVLRNAAGKPEKARALKTLSHLIADLHQPLNFGFAEDGGGATVKGTFRGKPVTLRGMWEEELLGTILNKDSPNGFLTIYGFFSIEGRAPRIADTTPRDWATESFWIMRTPATGYVGNPGGLEYDDTYVKQNRRVALEQLDKAAVRLAALLKELFGGT